MGRPLLMLRYKYIFRQNVRKNFYQAALRNCYGLKLVKKADSSLKNNKVIVLFIIIFGRHTFVPYAVASGYKNRLSIISEPFMESRSSSYACTWPLLHCSGVLTGHSSIVRCLSRCHYNRAPRHPHLQLSIHLQFDSFLRHAVKWRSYRTKWTELTRI